MVSPILHKQGGIGLSLLWYTLSTYHRIRHYIKLSNDLSMGNSDHIKLEQSNHQLIVYPSLFVLGGNAQIGSNTNQQNKTNPQNSYLMGSWTKHSFTVLCQVVFLNLLK